MSAIKNLRGRGRGNPDWVKGRSANPGGRPKAHHAMARMIHEQTEDGKELVEFALTVLRGTGPEDLRDGKSRRWAADWLSDRGFGKPMQQIEVSNDTDRPLNLAPLTDAQLEALAELDVEAPVSEAVTGSDGDDPAPN